jgi:hypothetical protein
MGGRDAPKNYKGNDSNLQTNLSGGILGEIVKRKARKAYFQFWNDFQSFIARLYGDTGFQRDRFLFRGQGRDYWEL